MSTKIVKFLSGFILHVFLLAVILDLVVSSESNPDDEDGDLYPSLACIIFGKSGCHAKCKILCTFYKCESFNAQCYDDLYCDCNEEFSQEVANRHYIQPKHNATFWQLLAVKFLKTEVFIDLNQTMQENPKLKAAVMKYLEETPLYGKELKQDFKMKFPQIKSMLKRLRIRSLLQPDNSNISIRELKNELKDEAKKKTAKRWRYFSSKPEEFHINSKENQNYIIDLIKSIKRPDDLLQTFIELRDCGEDQLYADISKYFLIHGIMLNDNFVISPVFNTSKIPDYIERGFLIIEIQKNINSLKEGKLLSKSNINELRPKLIDNNFEKDIQHIVNPNYNTSRPHHPNPLSRRDLQSMDDLMPTSIQDQQDNIQHSPQPIKKKTKLIKKYRRKQKPLAMQETLDNDLNKIIINGLDNQPESDTNSVRELPVPVTNNIELTEMQTSIPLPRKRKRIKKKKINQEPNSDVDLQTPMNENPVKPNTFPILYTSELDIPLEGTHTQPLVSVEIPISPIPKKKRIKKYRKKVKPPLQLLEPVMVNLPQEQKPVEIKPVRRRIKVRRRKMKPQCDLPETKIAIDLDIPTVYVPESKTTTSGKSNAAEVLVTEPNLLELSRDSFDSEIRTNIQPNQSSKNYPIIENSLIPVNESCSVSRAEEQDKDYMNPLIANVLLPHNKFPIDSHKNMINSAEGNHAKPSGTLHNKLDVSNEDKNLESVKIKRKEDILKQIDNFDSTSGTFNKELEPYEDKLNIFNKDINSGPADDQGITIPKELDNIQLDNLDTTGTDAAYEQKQPYYNKYNVSDEDANVTKEDTLNVVPNVLLNNLNNDKSSGILYEQHKPYEDKSDKFSSEMNSESASIDQQKDTFPKDLKNILSDNLTFLEIPNEQEQSGHNKLDVSNDDVNLKSDPVDDINLSSKNSLESSKTNIDNSLPENTEQDITTNDLHSREQLLEKDMLHDEIENLSSLETQDTSSNIEVPNSLTQLLQQNITNIQNKDKTVDKSSIAIEENALNNEQSDEQNKSNCDIDNFPIGSFKMKMMQENLGNKFMNVSLPIIDKPKDDSKFIEDIIDKTDVFGFSNEDESYGTFPDRTHPKSDKIANINKNKAIVDANTFNTDGTSNEPSSISSPIANLIFDITNANPVEDKQDNFIDKSEPSIKNDNSLLKEDSVKEFTFSSEEINNESQSYSEIYVNLSTENTAITNESYDISTTTQDLEHLSDKDVESSPTNILNENFQPISIYDNSELKRNKEYSIEEFTFSSEQINENESQPISEILMNLPIKKKNVDISADVDNLENISDIDIDLSSIETLNRNYGMKYNSDIIQPVSINDQSKSKDSEGDNIKEFVFFTQETKDNKSKYSSEINRNFDSENIPINNRNVNVPPLETCIEMSSKEIVEKNLDEDNSWDKSQLNANNYHSDYDISEEENRKKTIFSGIEMEENESQTTNKIHVNFDSIKSDKNNIPEDSYKEISAAPITDSIPSLVDPTNNISVKQKKLPMSKTYPCNNSLSQEESDISSTKSSLSQQSDETSTTEAYIKHLNSNNVTNGKEISKLDNSDGFSTIDINHDSMSIDHEGLLQPVSNSPEQSKEHETSDESITRPIISKNSINIIQIGNNEQEHSKTDEDTSSDKVIRNKLQNLDSLEMQLPSELKNLQNNVMLNNEDLKQINYPVEVVDPNYIDDDHSSDDWSSPIEFMFPFSKYKKELIKKPTWDNERIVTPHKLNSTQNDPIIKLSDENAGILAENISSKESSAKTDFGSLEIENKSLLKESNEPSNILAELVDTDNHFNSESKKNRSLPISFKPFPQQMYIEEKQISPYSKEYFNSTGLESSQPKLALAENIFKKTSINSVEDSPLQKDYSTKDKSSEDDEEAVVDVTNPIPVSEILNEISESIEAYIGTKDTTSSANNLYNDNQSPQLSNHEDYYLPENNFISIDHSQDKHLSKSIESSIKDYSLEDLQISDIVRKPEIAFSNENSMKIPSIEVSTWKPLLISNSDKPSVPSWVTDEESSNEISEADDYVPSANKDQKSDEKMKENVISSSYELEKQLQVQLRPVVNNSEFILKPVNEFSQKDTPNLESPPIDSSIPNLSESPINQPLPNITTTSPKVIQNVSSSLHTTNNIKENPDGAQSVAKTLFNTSLSEPETGSPSRLLQLLKPKSSKELSSEVASHSVDISQMTGKIIQPTETIIPTLISSPASENTPKQPIKGWRQLFNISLRPLGPTDNRMSIKQLDTPTNNQVELKTPLNSKTVAGHPNDLPPMIQMLQGPNTVNSNMK